MRALLLHDKDLPISQEEIARRERLLARLKLSQKYERKIGRASSDIGFKAHNKKLERLVNEQGKLDQRILRTSSIARSDFAVKIAIYRDWGADGVVSESLVRDIQRLLDAPYEFGRLWAFDPNEQIEKARAAIHARAQSAGRVT